MKTAVRALLVVLGLLSVQGVFGAEDHSFVSDGVRIHYVVQGSGEPVVLVHGFTGSINEWVDSGVLPNLARDYRVIALDLRGHGQSEKPRDVSAYGERMALDVIALMDHLGVAKAHVVGYSQGARIVGFLLATHGNRFVTAVLVQPSAPAFVAELSVAR